MININDTNLEDTVPTYDADVDVLELLHDATVLGLDDDGNEIPGYVFADTLSDLLGLSVEDLVDFAKENEYNIYTAKINGEEIPANIFVICAKGCDVETIKSDYKDIYELDIELSAVENDAESKEDELTEKLTNESIKPAIDWLNSIYFGLEDEEEDDNWFFSCWSHAAHFGSSWPSGQSVMAIQIDNDVEHIHIGYGDIETSEEFDYAVNSLKDELRKRTGEKNDDISITETVGGKSKGMSAEDIAKKHNVDIKQIEDQLEIGVKIEKEHTDSDEKARRIALDHLFEIPDYYTRLTKMEKDAGLKEDYYSDDTVQSIKQQIESVAKSSDAIKAKTQQDFYKCLGWLTLNVISITADIPLDVKDVFIKRFGNQPESAVRFIDIAELADSYSTGDFNKSTSIKLFSTFKCPKELKELIEKDSLEIKNFTLAKTLIKLYGFKFGDNDPDLNLEHIMTKLSGSQEKMGALEQGFSLVDINKKESSLEDGIKEFATIVNQDDEDWLTQHVRTIRIEVPDFLEKKFKFLFPDAVAHEDYVVKSTKIRTSGGYLSKWAVSAVLSVDTTDGAPTWLLPYFKGNQIKDNTALVLSLVHKYGFDFGKNSDEKIVESIQDIKPGTKIKLNKDTFYADSEVEGMFEDDADLLDEFLNAGFILKGTELFIPAESILTFVMSQSIDVYDLNGFRFEVSEWPGEFDYTIINESVTEENELKNRAKKHKKTDRKGARGWFVNYSAGNVEQNIARANHMMGDGSSASNVTVGSAPAGLGEDIELSEMLPHEDESKTEFVARFMSDDKMIKEYENPKQRYAVAMSYWEKK